MYQSHKKLHTTMISNVSRMTQTQTNTTHNCKELSYQLNASINTKTA